MLFGSLEFPAIEAIYAGFAALTAWRAELGGVLLLYSGLAPEGVAVAIASNIAGAASLGLEADAAQAKAALRAGVCDFVVNSLDESLRILKNEIRQHRPVSVVLTGDGDVAVSEMVARGVQPDVLAFAAAEFEQRGAWLLEYFHSCCRARLRPPTLAANDAARMGHPNFLYTIPENALDADVEDGRIAVTWGVAEAPLVHLPRLDALAAQALQVRDARALWIESAPRYLGRAFAGQRYLRMSAVEADAFVVAVRGATLPVAVTVTRDGCAVAVKS